VNIEVLDKEKYDAYRPMAAKAIEKYGGKYMVRGGAFEVLEGSWTPTRLVVFEFSSVEQAKTWYNSPEYREARSIRQGAARVHMVVVEGV
jgi:uncharacterized protein (DUF1330 family)